MSDSPTSALLAILDHHQPASLLCISREPVPAVSAFCAAHAGCELTHTDQVPLAAELTSRRYDLAIVADQLEALAMRTGVELLAGLRNLSVSRMAVLVDLQQAEGWQENDFFGLAMQRHARFNKDDRSLTLFTYDLAEYKNVPDWLNSKYWANPDMFDKYWW
ncbi:MAG: DUF6231 family protein [Halopseudomonas sp.]